jgi:hypothetical protein
MIAAIYAHISHTPPAGEAGGVPEVSRYARERGSWRSRATRRRSRRAASFATARRVAQIIRSIMAGRTAHTVPATDSVLFLELGGLHPLRADHGLSDHGLRDDIFRQGGPLIAGIYAGVALAVVCCLLTLTTAASAECLGRPPAPGPDARDLPAPHERQAPEEARGWPRKMVPEIRPDGRFYRWTGQASYGRLLAGLIGVLGMVPPG